MKMLISCSGITVEKIKGSPNCRYVIPMGNGKVMYIFTELCPPKNLILPEGRFCLSDKKYKEPLIMEGKDNSDNALVILHHYWFKSNARPRISLPSKVQWIKKKRIDTISGDDASHFAGLVVLKPGDFVKLRRKDKLITIYIYIDGMLKREDFTSEENLNLFKKQLKTKMAAELA